ACPAAYRRSNPGNFRWIHFTAHAVRNAENVLDSAILLSGQENSHRLYAHDVLEVPLRAQLVTLSACETAGHSYLGEGPGGFTWTFLRAGAENVIAGLWDVSDPSTPQLMGELYRGLTRGLGPAEALRQAKLALIRGGGPYQKPYYWSTFEVFT